MNFIPETQNLEFVVPPQKQPERIDKFLTREISNVSRTRIQQLIDVNYVLVDGKSVKSSYTIAPGEKIEVTLPRPEKTEVVPEDIALDIIYEDEFLLVINKPAGMVVHPAVGNRQGTLVNALLHHCKDLSGINGELRPGIVHRLDKDTSGLLVAAKNDVSHRNLSLQFSNRTISRNYIAMVWGQLRRRSGRIETFYGRSPSNRKKMAVLDEGKIAITNYQTIEVVSLLSVVKLKLETGRTHQIRVHMTHLGHPIFSDYVYSGRNRWYSSLNKQDRQIAATYLECLRRQALHAQTLSFIHPNTQQELEFTSPIPEDMLQLLHLARAQKETI